MEYREASPGDAHAIDDVARASLEATYADLLGDAAVELAVDRWYDPDELETDLESDDLLFVVAEDDGAVVAFSQALLLAGGGDGRIQWLHVYPDSRDAGVGAELLARTRDHLFARGVERITAEVLAGNEAGNEFYRDHGFSLQDQRTVEVGGAYYAENVYEDIAGEDVALEPVETSDGELFVDRGDEHRGKLAGFYPVYRSRDGTRRYGWLCGNCGSTDNAMDSMGRVACNQCDNTRKPDRWDAAYL